MVLIFLHFDPTIFNSLDVFQRERNWFIEQLQNFALSRQIRISFLTGDVHCASVGVLKTLTKGKRSSMAPSSDHRYMLNVVSSKFRSFYVLCYLMLTDPPRSGAIVNTP
jgi:hypothetical protein